ncbi:MAG: HD domain-containing protein [Blautia massiliensis (ex Durand et al. 2017)]|uniref:HD domain-containing protein n=1 Tax=Blautia massiliensis (ex Durand et al. 2017) TaxID=1737424 RepID=UPI0039998528
MDRVNQIWNHPLYQNELNKLQLLETDREFCRHTPEHFLNVARLAYIRALEENAPVSKELIYCTALLHDIGRARQYEDGTPHDEAGAAIAGQILNELGFSMEEMEAIVSAIRGHRAQTDPTVLGKLLYTADKRSRNCFSCKAEPECYWSPAKKNMTIQY